MGSRVFGYARDVVIAWLLGTGPAADALFIAIKFPSLFRRLLAEGAFNAAFIPMFAGLFASKGHDDSRTFAEEVLSISILLLSIFVVVAELLMPWILPIVVPGFVYTPARMELAIQFSRYTFPFIFFISLTALFSGILNSFEKFAAAASSQMIGNIFILVFVLALSSVFDKPGALLALSITGCGLVQLLWVVFPCHRMGMRLQVRRPRLTPGVRKLFKLMVPVAIGSGAHQLNVFIGTIIASMLPIGGVSYLYYAERFAQLPLSVIGTAMSTVLLPLIAKQIRSGDHAKALQSQNYGIAVSMLFMIPATVALIILAHPLVKIMLERGAFGAEAATYTAYTLMAFAAGLPAYVLSKIFDTSFYAREDTRTPLKIALVSVVVDIGLSLVLYKPLQHVGIALATAIAAWVNAALLGEILWRKKMLVTDERLRRFVPKVVVASLFMMPALFWLRAISEPLLLGNMFDKVAALVLVVLGGAIAFAVCMFLMGALNFRKLRLQFQN